MGPEIYGNYHSQFSYTIPFSNSFILSARLVGKKVYNGIGNEIECKGVKMESRGKLGNDEM